MMALPQSLDWRYKLITIIETSRSNLGQVSCFLTALFVSCLRHQPLDEVKSEGSLQVRYLSALITAFNTQHPLRPIYISSVQAYSAHELIGHISRVGITPSY